MRKLLTIVIMLFILGESTILNSKTKEDIKTGNVFNNDTLTIYDRGNIILRYSNENDSYFNEISNYLKDGAIDFKEIVVSDKHDIIEFFNIPTPTIKNERNKDLITLSSENNRVVTVELDKALGVVRNYFHDYDYTGKLEYSLDSIFSYKVADKCVGYYSFTELGYYCCLGNLNKVKDLVNSGADIERSFADDCFVGGALLCAAMVGNTEVVEYLISCDSDVDASFGESSFNPLIAAISQYQDSETAFANVKLLLEAGAKADGPGYLGFGGVPTFYPLIEAVKMGDINITKLLIEYEAGFEFENSWEDPIIDLAEQFPNKDIAQKLKELLITAGAK